MTFTHWSLPTTVIPKNIDLLLTTAINQDSIEFSFTCINTCANLLSYWYVIETIIGRYVENFFIKTICLVKSKSTKCCQHEISYWLWVWCSIKKLFINTIVNYVFEILKILFKRKKNINDVKTNKHKYLPNIL